MRGRCSAARMAADHVGDVHEVARLAAVAVDGHGLAGRGGRQKAADHTGIGRAGVLPRPVHVEEAQAHGGQLAGVGGVGADLLGRQLGAGVRAQRPRRRGLGDGQLRGIAVHGAAGGEHEALGPGLDGLADGVDRAPVGDGVAAHGVLHRLRDGRHGREVHDGLAAVDRVAHPHLVAHVPLDHLQAGAPLGRQRPGAVEVLVLAGAEVVQHAHVGAAREQRVDDVRSDEPGAAGDQGESVHAPILRHAPASRRPGGRLAEGRRPGQQARAPTVTSGRTPHGTNVSSSVRASVPVRTAYTSSIAPRTAVALRTAAIRRRGA